jgi:hypothetical protein
VCSGAGVWWLRGAACLLRLFDILVRCLMGTVCAGGDFALLCTLFLFWDRLFVARIEEFAYVPERLQQSFTNFAVALRLARGGPIAQLPVLSSGGVPYVIGNGFRCRWHGFGRVCTWGCVCTGLWQTYREI